MLLVAARAHPPLPAGVCLPACLQGRAKRGELHYLPSAQAYFDDVAHFREMSSMCSYTHPRVWQDNPGGWRGGRPRHWGQLGRGSCVAQLSCTAVAAGCSSPACPAERLALLTFSALALQPCHFPAADAPHKTFATLKSLKMFLQQQHRLQFCDICLEGRKVRAWLGAGWLGLWVWVGWLVGCWLAGWRGWGLCRFGGLGVGRQAALDICLEGRKVEAGLEGWVGR